MRILGKLVDERFWVHRQRSTSIAGITGGVVSICLFEYRYWVNHRWDWDLLAVALTFVLTKLALMTWYYLTN